MKRLPAGTPVAVQVSIWRLAAHQMLRDFRAGELRLLMVAVTLAVAALTAVGFFADRLNQGLARDARQLMGGDAIVASDNPTPTDFIEQARASGLRVAGSVTFPSMGRADDAQGGATRLVAVKAVSEAYPLRGRLLLRAASDGPESAATGAPQAGTVWVDPALLDALGLKIGDPLLLGDATLRIARTIVIEPDRGAGFMSFSPRVMLNEADLAATGLIQPASRVRYRLAVASPKDDDVAVQRFTTWADGQIKSRGLRGIEVDSLASGRPEMTQTLDRAEKFLNLVALLAALLAAVAVAIASRDFANRHLDDCAMLRVLGRSQRHIAVQYLIEFGLVGLVASLLGVALGFAVHHVFVWLLSGLVHATLPAVTIWPALFGIGVGLTLLLGFGLPPVLQLAQVPPLRVIRRDVGAVKPASLAVLGAGPARLRGAADGGFVGPQARPDRGGRIRGRCVRLRPAQLVRGGCPSHRGARITGAALARSRDAPDRCSSRLRRAAGFGAQCRPARARAAGAAPHGSDQQLAPGDSTRCARPVRDQRAA